MTKSTYVRCLYCRERLRREDAVVLSRAGGERYRCPGCGPKRRLTDGHMLPRGSDRPRRVNRKGARDS